MKSQKFTRQHRLHPLFENSIGAYSIHETTWQLDTGSRGSQEAEEAAEGEEAEAAEAEAEAEGAAWEGEYEAPLKKWISMNFMIIFFCKGSISLEL